MRGSGVRISQAAPMFSMIYLVTLAREKNPALDDHVFCHRGGTPIGSFKTSFAAVWEKHDGHTSHVASAAELTKGGRFKSGNKAGSVDWLME